MLWTCVRDNLTTSLFVAAIGVIVFAALAGAGGHSLHAGAYLAIVLGVGLLFLAALQIRGILMSRRQTY
jgi:hypothetical protein